MILPVEPSPPSPRRDFLLRGGAGFGGVVLAALLSEDHAGAGEAQRSPAALAGGIHHRAKAKRVVQLFMNGGVSQLDTFDYKPGLDRLHGERFDPGAGERVESVTSSPGFKVLRSPFAFRRHGACGRWVSEVFPHTARLVDDLAFLMSMTSSSNVHGLASYMQNTGFTIPGFPCAGAWISYALGRIDRNLPEFVVLPDPRGLPYNNRGNFSAGFLPARHQGTVIDTSADPPIPYLSARTTSGSISAEAETAGRALLAELNERHRRRFPDDSRLEARIDAYELAARMQVSAPPLFDVASESAATRARYGVGGEYTDEFARRLIIARRMLERGVRFVQVWSGPGGPTRNWDNHANIASELPYMTRQVDQPIAAFVEDLKSRGLLDDTVIIWTTEFGRMPFSQGQGGRDHNGGTFVTWLAGAGIRGGSAVGESDEWGWKAVDPIWCYDLHATLLHLLGIDHTRLTYRHNGFDRRLTDVHGHVIEGILA